ncbi:hypothetical protein PHAVU_010G103700 [Phaseolus vulgaris]|uniref:PGG domain-containing protein n=1 Tax=Phaseolus vulgaris TaxID=3885 RepID=V7ASE4_PHAVU|nr:hypothetical protein PHAVU_010G103700g [Phaseolus vulgaris]ESW07126.1 hypothetical protein PHAVU_010G103700g [Phaseolus vulgaris]
MTTKDKWLIEMRGNLSMVATVIPTISFQNVVNPPGGVRSGQSVLAENFPNEYVLFLKLNSLYLISSLTVLLFLVSGLSLANRFLSSILSLDMYVMLSSLSLTYIVVLSMVTIHHIWDSTKTIFYRILYVWIAVIGLLVLSFFTSVVSWVLNTFIKH